MSEHGGIEEILRTGRAPGLISRGVAHEPEFKRGALPHTEGIGAFSDCDADGLNRRLCKSVGIGTKKARKAAEERRCSGRKPSLKHVGRTTMYEYLALQRETGDKHVWRNPREALKRLGKDRLVD